LLLPLLLLPHTLQELAPELWVRFKNTQCCTCAGAAGVVLYTPCHHAHVYCLHYHHHTCGLYQPLYCCCDLLRDTLLHLQPLRVALHQLQCLSIRQRLLLLGAAATPSTTRRCWQQVLYVQGAVEGQHVVLTLRHERHMVLVLLVLLVRLLYCLLLLGVLGTLLG
jgi:hypothetical protein